MIDRLYNMCDNKSDLFISVISLIIYQTVKVHEKLLSQLPTYLLMEGFLVI